MSLQATIAKLLLKLPASWKVKMAGGKPVELGGLGRAGVGQTLEPLLVGGAAAHHADVADLRGQRALHGGDVELGVVGEDAHRVAGAERGAVGLEHGARPTDHDLVGHREAPPGRPGVGGTAPVLIRASTARCESHPPCVAKRESIRDSPDRVGSEF